ncbi:hypothetical protein EJ419_05525 [Alloscardovia theropitheci]|uniref:Uncharacterized protein n=1 Tax=Alloscardovia theropitheci TaxID=2496842 RepID=A0A4R0QPI1_9BIFI|nr:hypothetical protein EJ419_05525 [Alloscardovia theropitheci]
MYRFLAEGPTDVKPDYNYFPFMKQLIKIASGISGAAIYVLVIMVILGTVGVIMGKLGSSNMAQRIGWGMVIMALIGAAVVASAGGLVMWATQQQLI